MRTYNRWQITALTQALKTRRVVIIAGARQCGKTTLSKSLLTSNVTYRTLDDSLLLQSAKADPQSFVKHDKPLMIIDEVQKAAELLPAIKIRVDENTRPGQYILTGSANIHALPGATESLAGRIRKIPLRPLSQGELLKNNPHFLENAFKQIFSAPKKKFTRDEIVDIAMRGGYPEPLFFSHEERQLWHRNYIDALLDRDLKDILNIRRRDAMEQLVQVVCAWSTKPVDMAAIGSHLSLQRHTVNDYFNALEALYLIDHIPPYAKTDYARIGRQKKLIVNDSGLMASVLRWRKEDIVLDADRLGKLIETHAGNELQKHVDTTEEKCVLSHYRDRDHREIDFLIENDRGDILAIEVKAGSNIDVSHFKHIKWFRENVAPKRKKYIGIVLHTGEQAVSFGDALWAVPIACLY